MLQSPWSFQTCYKILLLFTIQLKWFGWTSTKSIPFGVYSIVQFSNKQNSSNFELPQNRFQHWKNKSVESTHWRHKIDDFWQALSFDAKDSRFYRSRHRFYAFVLFCPEKSQMVRLEFKPTTIGSDFSINIVNVLAISAPRLPIYVEVKY
jgi:hypothetical protein